MVESTSVPQFVETALAERDVRYRRAPGPTLHVPHGSAEVQIEFDDLGGGTVVRVSSVVLDGMDLENDREALALRAVNDRNRNLRFGKFVLDRLESQILLEYDLLGDFLQAEELMNAVTSVAQVADDHDDLLLDELGSGRRAVDRA